MQSICYLVRPCAGGIEAHIKGLINYFGSRYRILLVVPKGSGLLEDKDCLNAVEQALVVPMSGSIDPGKDLLCFRELVKILQKYRPSLLHMHGYKAALCGCLAGRIARVPALITAHNFPSFRMEGLILSSYLRAMDKWGKCCPVRFITVSQALAVFLKQKMGIPESRISVVHNGIDPAPFETPGQGKTRSELKETLLEALDPPLSRKRPGAASSNNKIIVGTVGRLAPQKGLEHFIRASAILAARHPSVQFVITGEGPLFPFLQGMVRKFGLSDRVCFTGYRSSIPEVLSALDVFVLPSISEGLSITLLEALAAAKPVVATSTGGIPEILVEGTGILVSPGDNRAMAAAVSELLQNPGKARQMAEAGQRRVKTLFSRESMLSKTETVYGEVLGGA